MENNTTQPTPKRHALGLPGGSVRAIHVIGIIGLVCGIILLPGQHTIPPYLIYLLFLMIGGYFAAHGVSISAPAEPSPLYLPGGTVRFIIVAALVGCIGWKLYQDQQGLIDQFARSLDDLKKEPVLPLIILGGFILGVIIAAVLRQLDPAHVYRDFEAWISLIALVGIVAAAVIHLVVDPSLGLEQKLYLPMWESFVGGVVAFYFGERC